MLESSNQFLSDSFEKRTFSLSLCWFIQRLFIVLIVCSSCYGYVSKLLQRMGVVYNVVSHLVLHVMGGGDFCVLVNKIETVTSVVIKKCQN